MATNQNQNVDEQQQGRGSERQAEGGSRAIAPAERSGIRPESRRMDPFTAMRRWMDDIERAFGFGGLSPFSMSPMTSLDEETADFSPNIEVFEKNGELCVYADLPGVKKEDVRVQIEDDRLVVAGKREDKSERSEGGYYRSERSYGEFRRTIPLPRGVDPNAIQASFDNGVLEVRAPLPKQEERGRRIEVKSGSSATTEPKPGAGLKH